MEKSKISDSDFVTVPGETLLETLQEKGISQTEFAERCGIPTKTINEIVKGKTMITTKSALQFERVLGIPSNFWVSRERHYREYITRKFGGEL